MVKVLTNKQITFSLLALIGGLLAIAWPSQWIGGAIVLVGLVYGTAVGGLPHTPLRWPIGLLVLLALFSLTLITADPAATQHASNWLAASFAGYALVLSWANTPSRQQTGVILLVLMGVGLACAAPFITTWGKVKITLIPTAVYTFWPTVANDTVHPNTLASAFLLLLPLPAAWVFAHWHTRPASWWGASAALLLMALMFLLTQSRAGYIALAISFILLLWVAQWRKTAGLLTLALLLGTAILTFAPTPELSSLDTAVDTGSWQFRLFVWNHTLRLLSDFPFTGVGMGAFNLVSERLYPFPSLDDKGTHNLYLAIAADMGLPALMAYLAILGNTGWMAWRVSQRPSEKPSLPLPLTHGLAIGLLALHLHGLFDNTLWSTRLAFLPWLFIGLLNAIHTNGRDRDRDRDSERPS